MTGCVGLCEAFPVGVRNDLIPSRPLFGAILRQLEGSTFYRCAGNKKKRLLWYSNNVL